MGGDDYVDCGHDSSLYGMNTLTFSAWVKWEGGVQSDEEGILGNQNDGYYIRWDSQTSKMEIYFRTAVTGYLGGAYLNTDISDGNFHHILGAYNGANMRVYLDNVISSTIYNATGAIGSYVANDFFIGTYLADAYNGIIDEVRISKAVRTADQRALFYDRPWDLYRRVSRPIWSIPAVGVTIPIFMQNMRGSFNSPGTRGGFIN